MSNEAPTGRGSGRGRARQGVGTAAAVAAAPAWLLRLESDWEHNPEFDLVCYPVAALLMGTHSTKLAMRGWHDPIPGGPPLLTPAERMLKFERFKTLRCWRCWWRLWCSQG